MSPKLSFTEVINYIKYIEETYKSLIKFTLQESFIDILTMIKHFARVQDSFYNNKYLIMPDNHLADDLFEICLAIKYEEFFKEDVRKIPKETEVTKVTEVTEATRKRNLLMHDAWTLGKMFNVGKDKKNNPILIRQSNDNGDNLEKQNAVQITEENFDEIQQKYENDENKDKIVVYINIKREGEINNGINYYFLWKRIYKSQQLRHFDNLTPEQQNKDITPQIAFLTLTPTDRLAIKHRYLNKLLNGGGGLGFSTSLTHIVKKYL